ncbi:anti-sigma-I factor RsgI family protein [Clostridium chauvoei]
MIEVKGINDDGKIIDFKDIKGKNINDGMLEIKHKLIEKNYISKNKTILFGFAFNSNSDDIEYEDKVKMIIKNNFNDNKIAFLKGDSNSINNADNKGISLGRYEASLDFHDDKLEDMIENLSVEEILNAIKNKDKYIFWNSDIEEELKDELEDKNDVDDNNDDLEHNENDDLD